jgi:hypothetical protein
VPADVPHLQGRHLRTAFRRSASARSWRPSPDGGVYLLGIRGDFERVLTGVPWCTPQVFARLLAGPGGAAVLPPLPDMDGHRHLRALRRDPGLDAELSLLVDAVLGPVVFLRSSPRPLAVIDPCRSPRLPAAPRSPPEPLVTDGRQPRRRHARAIITCPRPRPLRRDGETNPRLFDLFMKWYGATTRGAWTKDQEAHRPAVAYAIRSGRSSYSSA